MERQSIESRLETSLRLVVLLTGLCVAGNAAAQNLSFDDVDPADIQPVMPIEEALPGWTALNGSAPSADELPLTNVLWNAPSIFNVNEVILTDKKNFFNIGGVVSGKYAVVLKASNDAVFLWTQVMVPEWASAIGFFMSTTELGEIEHFRVNVEGEACYPQFRYSCGNMDFVTIDLTGLAGESIMLELTYAVYGTGLKVLDGLTFLPPPEPFITELSVSTGVPVLSVTNLMPSLLYQVEYTTALGLGSSWLGAGEAGFTIQTNNTAMQWVCPASPSSSQGFYRITYP